MWNAAEEIAAGRVEVDLGGSLFKKRLPGAGKGKRGGYRVLVGYKRPKTERIIFLYAFAKNDKANISTNEQAALSIAAESFISATDKQVNKLLAESTIWEVICNE